MRYVEVGKMAQFLDCYCDDSTSVLIYCGGYNLLFIRYEHGREIILLQCYFILFFRVISFNMFVQKKSEVVLAMFSYATDAFNVNSGCVITFPT